MKKLVQFLTLVAAFVVLTGCASIVGGSGPQAISVNTIPADAKLEVTDLNTGAPVITASTPYTMMLNRSSGYFKKSQYKIKVSKEGFMAQEQVITPNISGWYAGGNIIFGGLIGWLIVDPASGAMYTFDQTPRTFSLYSDNEEGRAAFQDSLEKKYREQSESIAKSNEEANKTDRLK